MAIKIEGMDKIKERSHHFKDSYGFIDNDGDFYIVGRQGTVIRMVNCFDEYFQDDYEYIEDFLEHEFGTTLLKSFESKDSFDVTITIK